MALEGIPGCSGIIPRRNGCSPVAGVLLKASAGWVTLSNWNLQ